MSSYSINGRFNLNSQTSPGDLLLAHVTSAKLLYTVSEIGKHLSPPLNNTLKISGSTSSRDPHKLIRSWINYCKTNHGICEQWDKSRSDWNPTRLLDVGEDEASTIRLYEPRQAEGPVIYNTLSHRWGTSNMITLLEANKNEFEQEIPITSLNHVFQDAISTTRRLGVRYLWIDCLCIIQDSQDGGDWRMESSRMGEVYKYGYCNISAIKSSYNGSDPCYTDRSPLSIRPLAMKLHLGQRHHWNQKPKQYCVTKFLEEWDTVEAASLNTRGWVFQERLMSPRTIYFGRDQILFECCCSRASERWPGLIKTDSQYPYVGLKQEQANVHERYLRDFDPNEPHHEFSSWETWYWGKVVQ